MRADEIKLLQFLENTRQFAVPIYQRTYSWRKPQCQQLWDDIMNAGKKRDIKEHFVGSVVVVKEREETTINWSPLLVIDGQQRLTTVSLILEALARKLDGGDEPIDGFSSEKIRRRYLLNEMEKGEKGYKLILTKTDKNTFIELLDRKDGLAKGDSLLKPGFQFFIGLMERLNMDELSQLCIGLNKLMIVEIKLELGRDNPQRIFESMNSKGVELNKADLIRNFILMDLELEHQERLYKDYWYPMEEKFGKEQDLFDRFMRDYLTIKNEGVIPIIGEVYEEFKVYYDNKNVDTLVEDIHRFANYYCAMALGKEPDSVLASAFKELRELRGGVRVAYPLLLKLYDDYENKLLSRDDFAQIIRLIVDYIFRRYICGIATNILDKTFATFGKGIDEDRYLESVKAIFILFDFKKSFPSDEDFRNALKQSDIYRPNKTWMCEYLLLRLENHKNKEPVQPGNCSIEHIMPQSLSDKWREDLGTDGENIHQDWLHKLGNLTLTGYNSELSNHSFGEKRDEYSRSSFRLTRELEKFEEWNDKTIQERADRLAQLATIVWSRPKLSREVLDTHRPVRKIDGHEYLAKQGITRQLFDAFSEQVQSLNPVITEEVLKWHIAYKLDYKNGTNFVNVAPQAKKLKLTLDIDFHELNDPEGMANDFADRNYWMPGNVGLDVKSEDEIPYAIGLVRQALEKQIGEPSNDGK